jgi:hypothetical protein
MLDILVCGGCAQCGADNYLKLYGLTYIVEVRLVLCYGFVRELISTSARRCIEIFRVVFHTWLFTKYNVLLQISFRSMFAL